MCSFYLYAKPKSEIQICSYKHETGLVYPAMNAYINLFSCSKEKDTQNVLYSLLSIIAFGRRGTCSYIRKNSTVNPLQNIFDSKLTIVLKVRSSLCIDLPSMSAQPVSSVDL